MKRIVFFSLLTVASVFTYAQDPMKDVQKTSQKEVKVDTTQGWKTGGMFSVNIGQGGSKNWAAGAEKFSFSTAAYLSVFANYVQGRFSWNNSLDLGYAMVNTTSQGVRKTDDKIDFFSKAGHALSEKISLSGVVNFRSQFTPGYDYNYRGAGVRRQTSGFLAPAYLTIAPGIDWHPTSYFSVFISPVSSRTVIVARDTKAYHYPGGVIPPEDGGGFETPLAVNYGVNPARKVRPEFGGFASINFNKEILKNVQFKSRIDLYSNYLSTERYTVTAPDQITITKVDAKPKNIDVFWTNGLVMKVNKYLNVTYNLDIIYDDDVRQFGPNGNAAGTQIRTLLGVGFAATF
ncbi:DUF3078 domain-containing protein [Gynurincola endophyticus]|uniref:DUF3078 domain-containing protein n=1 Tax=Gynurincola endophyticus TaxID=2479004 RepID=UPI00131506F2|nr:DUF3078 domain-containing protein [Gynurincola endophyticus]